MNTEKDAATEKQTVIKDGNSSNSKCKSFLILFPKFVGMPFTILHRFYNLLKFRRFSFLFFFIRQHFPGNPFGRHGPKRCTIFSKPDFDDFKIGIFFNF